jgi:DNA polymerase III subunit beta
MTTTATALMTFTVSRDELYSAVSSVSKATASRVVQPILSNILMECDSPTGGLRLSATDLDFSLQTTLNSDITGVGRTTLSAKKLTEILAKLPGKSTVSFEIDSLVQSCRVSCGSSVFDLRTLPAEEFPLIPTINVEGAIKLKLSSLVRCIKQTEYAASRQDTTNILGGVFLKLTNTVLDMVATDGSRLARRTEAVEGLGLDEAVTAIIPARILAEFMKLATSYAQNQSDDPAAGHDDDMALFSLQKGQVFLSTKRFNAVSRLLDGQYPRYEQLIPQSSSITASMNRAVLTSALERTAVLANERTQIVKLQLTQGQLLLAADTPDVGQSKDVMPIHFNEPEPLVVAFNFKYVLDALKVMEGETVLLETNGSLAPALLKDADAPDKYLGLIMPVQVK